LKNEIRFSEKKYNFFSTLPQQHFTIGLCFLAIFHTSWTPQGVWKIAKSSENCTGWAVEVWKEFFFLDPVFDKLAFSLNIAVVMHPNDPKFPRNE